jgi:hypothetical protein
MPNPPLAITQLTRHAVCLGMTGSGKTGLCIGLLEDIASQGVPVLAIDPKGDLANLALVLPALDAASFEGWVDDPAAKAVAWREGLAASGLGPADLEAFRERVEVRVLTPGSESGTPINVLAALTAAPAWLRSDAEGLREYVVGAVSALLGLIGRDADPLTDPSAILLARLLSEAFANGEDLPLERLIPAVVDPPFTQVGYFHVDTFLPREDRLKLAKQLNAVVASPAFSAWRRGVPLDVGGWLTPEAGARTPITVLYLAHLDEPGRMFFLTLLLHAVVGWSRRQPGRSSLRGLLYFDEVMGYLPPHPKNPPTKWPVLTLMKQARAVGLGVMLSTQNPVDLDYKAMSNAGTWLVGRLRTRQDRARVIEGLAAAGVSPGDVDDDLAALAPRAFLVLDDHGVRAITSRHTLSLLRGPLTRAEVARLGRLGPSGVEVEDGLLPHPPPLPGGLTARWLHEDGVAALGLTPAAGPAWVATLYARIGVRFVRGALVIEERVVHRVARGDVEGTGLHGAPPAHALELPDRWLRRHPPAEGRYLPLPRWIADPDHVDRLTRAWLDAAANDEPGPDEAPLARRDDVRLLGSAVVWIPR